MMMGVSENSSSPFPVIMDFTGAYRCQRFAAAPDFSWIDCRGINGTDCYCDKEGEAALRKLIAAFSPYGLHFLDSGNYHYMTKLWTDRLREPFSLVLFDHHTDMQPPVFEGLMSCGGWVKDMLDGNSFLKNVLIAGVPETDAAKVRSERVHVISEEDFAVSGCPAEPLSSVLPPGVPVYLSVDKDVLSTDSAITNWDQGGMRLEVLTGAISRLMRDRKVIGMDVCGEPDAAAGFHARNSNLNSLVNGRLSELWKFNNSTADCSNPLQSRPDKACEGRRR